MEWKQFKNESPVTGRLILYTYNEVALLAHVEKNKELRPVGHECIYDDCDCYLLFSENDFWMYFPDFPKPEDFKEISE